MMICLINYLLNINIFRNLKFMPEVIFNGPEGRLEGRYHHSKISNAPAAILCTRTLSMEGR